MFNTHSVISPSPRRACQTTLLLRDSLSLSLQLFAVTATLKSIDYNVAMTFILNNNNNNKCIGDDTKAAARQRPNCILKTKT